MIQLNHYMRHNMKILTFKEWKSFIYIFEKFFFPIRVCFFRLHEDKLRKMKWRRKRPDLRCKDTADDIHLEGKKRKRPPTFHWRGLDQSISLRLNPAKQIFQNCFQASQDVYTATPHILSYRVFSPTQTMDFHITRATIVLKSKRIYSFYTSKILENT